jgi:hypothetical protein
MTWVETLLTVIILLLLGWILFSRSGSFKSRALRKEVKTLGEDARILGEANEALRNTKLEKERRKPHGNLFEFIRDVVTLNHAASGSSMCKKILMEKYGIQPGPELVGKILLSQPGMDAISKRMLLNEIIIGEAGRIILRDLDTSIPLPRAAEDVGMPLLEVKKNATKLQLLGYLNGRMKLTDRGKEALVTA